MISRVLPMDGGTRANLFPGHREVTGFAVVSGWVIPGKGLSMMSPERGFMAVHRPLRGYLRSAWGFALVISFLFLAPHGSSAGQSSLFDLRRDFDILYSRFRQNPGDVQTINSLGIIYARFGRISDAITLWERGLALDPHYIHLYNNLGSALKNQRRYAEAERIFRLGLRITPSVWIYYNLGVMYGEMKKANEAVTCFQSCLGLKPGFEPAQRKLAELGVRLFDPGENHFPGIPGVTIPRSPVAMGGPPDQSEIRAPVRYPWLGSPESVRESDAGNLPPTYFPSGTTAPAKQTPGRRDASEGASEPPAKPMTVEDCVAAISRINRNKNMAKVVALTFDDGPHAVYTKQLLDILKAEGARGTFFVLGSRAETYPDLLSRMSAEGHEIGNHTWNHKSLVSQGRGSGLADLRKTADLLEMMTGSKCRLVRPPFGHTNQGVLKMINSEGWHQVMWDADSRDWQGGSRDRMLARVIRSLSPGAVVLFHDIHPGVLKVLPVLIPALKRCGYSFVTVSQLIRGVEVAG